MSGLGYFKENFKEDGSLKKFMFQNCIGIEY